jgi:uncharacterized circularly permuted ATP-grasp superfamily protein/uncharacterized alpha-E superfamily protein
METIAEDGGGQGLDGGLVRGYRTPPDVYDEMRDERGEVRPQWRYLAGALATLGLPALHDRWRDTRRLLRESGATYNVYGDPHGLERPWQLDPIPMLVSSDEWHEIESGLVQRAELLDLILKDVYGPQELIRAGILPLELVYAHTGFLRPCHPVRAGAHTNGGATYALTLYAADVARGPDGRVRVLSDRTQAPSGAGYALENRVVMSRVWPSLYRDSHVHRLSLFFQNVRTSLAALSPRRQSDPHVVLLTPGPLNETYFEQSYLAGYLGYTLARGADLVVQDGKVWLRSMRRLEPVDVVLRRVDDHYCDPLELYPESRLGVPGLVQAVRRGTVVVANPLGSSVLENPALNAFLPAIAKHFLGRELQLPSVDTWWCGRTDDREHVLANLERLVIRPIYRQPRTPTVLGALLDDQQRRRLAAVIRERPQWYVAQEQIRFSSVPTLVDDGIEGRQAVIRTFLAAREDGYVVMPGALTRIAPSQESWLLSNQAGALSKDTWILATEPEKQVSLMPTARGASLRVPRAALPGGAADNLFWLGRYAERAEGTIRVVRAALRAHRGAVELETPDRRALDDVLVAVTHVSGTLPGFVGDDMAARRASPMAELLSVVLDAERVGSVAFDVHAMLTAAYAIRDHVSPDAWRVLTEAGQRLDRLQGMSYDGATHELHDALDGLVAKLVGAFALARESMTRDEAWLFLDVGRRIERAFLVATLLRATIVQRRDTAVESELVESVLHATETLMTYHRRHHAKPEVEPMLALLLLDETNPRSLAYQLARIEDAVAQIARDDERLALSEEARLALEAATSVRLVDLPTLVAFDDGGDTRGTLDALLARVRTLLARTSDALTRGYFSDVRGPRHLARVPETTS